MTLKKNLDEFARYMDRKNIGYHFNGFEFEELRIHAERQNCNVQHIMKIKPDGITKIIFE